MSHVTYGILIFSCYRQISTKYNVTYRFLFRYKYIIIPICFWYWLSSFFRKQKMDLYITTPEKLIIFCRGCMFQLAVSNFFDKKRKLILRSYVRKSSFYISIYARISVRLNINFVIDNQNKRLVIVQ